MAIKESMGGKRGKYSKGGKGWEEAGGCKQAQSDKQRRQRK